jgi:lipoyl(octanoyl) transferase
MQDLRPLRIERLGTLHYAEALERQRARRAEVVAGTADDTLFVLQHPPVITTGRNAGLKHLRISPEQLAQRGIALVETDRGGDITYHGPGQLVGYPIVSLQPDEKDLRRYVFCLEEIIVRTAADFGVRAERVSGLRGVWVGNDKLAAIGVRLSRWVTSHGFALNIDPDMSAFDLIVPCGIHGRGVTSLARVCSRPVDFAAIEAAVVAHSAEVLQRHAYAPAAGFGLQLHRAAAMP